MNLLDDAGFTSVVATNCEQEYDRYAPPRRPPVDDDDHRVGVGREADRARRRPLRHDPRRVPRRRRRARRPPCCSASSSSSLVPADRPPRRRERSEQRPMRPRPALTQDNAFWFEGAKRAPAADPALRAVRDAAPPAAADVRRVRSLRVGHRRGQRPRHRLQLRGEPLPAGAGVRLPAAVGLVELEEGTRLVANLVGVEPGDVSVGMPVEVEWVDHDADLTLPAFRPVRRSAAEHDGLHAHRGAGRRPRPGRRRSSQGHGTVERVKEVEARRRARRPRAVARARRRRPARHRAARGARRQRPRARRAVPASSSSRAGVVAPVPLWPTLVLGALADRRVRHRRAAGELAAGRRARRASCSPPRSPSPASTTRSRPQVHGDRATAARLAARRRRSRAVPAAHVADARPRAGADRRRRSRVFLVDPAGAGVERRVARHDRPLEGRAPRVRRARRPSRSATRRRASARSRGCSTARCVGLCALQVGVCEARARAWPPTYTSERAAVRPAAVDVPGRRAQGRRRLHRHRGDAGHAVAGGVAARRRTRRDARGAWWRSGGRPRAASASCTSRQHLHGGMGADVDYPVHRYFLWGKQIEDTLGGASAHARPARPSARGGTGMTTTTSLRYDDVNVGDELPTLADPADAHADRGHRDRVARLPGRAPRPGPRAGARLARHLHEHPHDQRVRRPVHHRLGGARRGAQEREDPARRAELPGRHDDDDGHGHEQGRRRRSRSRSGAPTTSATTSPARSRSSCPRRERVATSSRDAARDRRDRRHRVLQGVGPLRAAARGRGVRVPRSPTPASSRPQIDGMVTYTQDTNPEIEIARNLGIGELSFFSPHPPRRRRRVRHRPAGGAGRARRRRRLRRLLPRVQRAVGATASAPACRTARRRRRPSSAHFAWYAPFGLLTPAQWVAMFATRYMHEYGATSEDFGRVAVADRKHAATNPKAWFYEKPITLEEHQAVALDRRAAAPARLLPGERRRARRSSSRRSSGRATCRNPPAIINAAAQGAGDDQDMMTSYYRDVDHRPARDGPGRPPALEHDRPRSRRHPDRGHLRPLHAARAAAARGVRVLRAGRGEGLHRATATSSSAAASRSTPTAASSARRTSTA